MKYIGGYIIVEGKVKWRMLSIGFRYYLMTFLAFWVGRSKQFLSISHRIVVPTQRQARNGYSRG